MQEICYKRKNKNRNQRIAKNSTFGSSTQLDGIGDGRTSLLGPRCPRGRGTQEFHCLPSLIEPPTAATTLNNKGSLKVPWPLNFSMNAVGNKHQSRLRTTSIPWLHRIETHAYTLQIN